MNGGPRTHAGWTTYRYAESNGAYPWSNVSWAGGVPPTPNPLFGGIVAVPDSAAGLVRLSTWWPDTTALHLVRLQPDGSRVPVRGAYPLTVRAGTTRRNFATNPSAASGLNGYVPADGNPTLSTVSDSPAPTGTGVRCTLTADGSCGLTIPTALTVQQPGQPITLGIALRFSSRPSGGAFTIGWTDATGVALSPTTVGFDLNVINTFVNQWAHAAGTFAAPVTGVFPLSVSLKVVADGLPAGGTMDVAQNSHENGQTDGSYVDGDSLGGLWTGLPGFSASVVAAVQTLADGEAPFDVPLAYQVINPVFGGGSSTSGTTILVSGGRSWLTHPDAPTRPIRARVTAAPDLNRPAVSASFAVLGRTNPVVVASARSSPTGTLVLDTETFADRDALLALLADGAPLLLRAPGDYGLGYGWWIAIGDVGESPGGRPQWNQTRALTLPFTVVDAPLAPATFAVA